MKNTTNQKNPNNISNPKKILGMLLKYGTYVLLVFFCVILTLTTSTFLTKGNLTNVLLQTTVTAILAAGMTFVVVIGCMDMSVGTTMAVASCIATEAFKLGANWWQGLLIMLLIGMLFGFINGFSTAYIGMPSFLVTLATQSLGKGISLGISNGRSYYDIPEAFDFIPDTNILGIPLMIIIVIVIYIIMQIILKRTLFGRRVCATGGNKEAARVSGVDTKKTMLLAYILCGSMVGIASIIQTARMGSFWPTMGTGLEFQAVAAVVIGGASLSGGAGSLLGTFVGVLLMGIISNALNLWGVNANWQEAARGLIIFFAVFLDTLRSRFNKGAE